MKKSMVKNLGTWFGLGDLPKAPGTFGTLGGIPIYVALIFLRKLFPNYMLYNSFYFIFLMTFFMVAVYVSDICEKEIYKEKDPQNIVIDEVLGYLTTLFLINPVGWFQTGVAVILGFILFRIFDILKPGPIYKSQFLGSGVGVVIDDFLAGIISNFILACIWTFIFYR